MAPMGGGNGTAAADSPGSLAEERNNTNPNPDPTWERGGGGGEGGNEEREETKQQQREEEEEERDQTKKTTKVVVVMGATGSGKSRLAIDLASYFPSEIVNADSMQVYRGLDVLTNKVPLPDRRGVPHHLLGTIDPNVDFTSKDFRDLAVPIIHNISSCGRLPIVVGGTNYYIQALVSPFLFDDLVEDMDECFLNASQGVLKPKFKSDQSINSPIGAFDRLKEIDPAAANRIHPNDHRKIDHYLSLYESSGVLPSELFQGKTSEGRSGVGQITSDMIAVLYGWMLLSQRLTDMLRRE